MIEAELPDGTVLEFPDGTSQDVIQGAVKKMLNQSPTAPAESQLPEGGALSAAGDVVKTLAGGVAGEIAGGLGGLGTALVGGGEQGGQAVRDIQAGIQEATAPSTQAGQQALQSIGKGFDYLTDIARAPAAAASFVRELGLSGGDIEAARKAFERTQEVGPIKEFAEISADVTGSPAIGAAIETAPVAIAELVGLGAIKKLRTGTRLIDPNGNPTKALRKSLDKQGLVFENLSPDVRAKIPVVADKSLLTSSPLIDQSTEQTLISQIKAGGRDDALAGLKVVNNAIRPDRRGLEALKQGFAPGFVQSIKTATPETKAQMDRMVKIARRIKKQERVGLDIRPGEIVGDSISKRVKFIRNQASNARKELNQIAEKQLKGRQINPEVVTNQLGKSLQDLDIKIIEDARGVPIPDFSGSLISKDRGSQKAIKDVISLLSEGGRPDALRAHKLKRQLDNIIDFNKKSARGLGDEGRNVLKDIRYSLNQAVRDVDKDYARVNDVMSRSLTALDDFQKAAGTTIDIFGESANSAIGTKSRALMSNINSRVNLENAINGLDETSRVLGAKFGDDVKDLAMFANALDARFGAVAKTSFQGNIEQAINRVLNQGMSQEILEQGASLAAKGIKKVRGINEFNALEAMTDLLKER